MYIQSIFSKAKEDDDLMTIIVNTKPNQEISELLKLYFINPSLETKDFM